MPYEIHPDDDLTHELLTGHNLKLRTHGARGDNQYGYNVYRPDTLMPRAKHDHLHKDLLSMGWKHLGINDEDEHRYGRAADRGFDSGGFTHGAVLNVDVHNDNILQVVHHPSKKLMEMVRFSEHLTRDEVDARTKYHEDMTHEVLSSHLPELPEGRGNGEGSMMDWRAIYSKKHTENPDHEAIVKDLNTIGWKTRPHLDYALHDFLPGHRLNFVNHNGATGEYYTVVHQQFRKP